MSCSCRGFGDGLGYGPVALFYKISAEQYGSFNSDRRDPLGSTSFRSGDSESKV